MNRCKRLTFLFRSASRYRIKARGTVYLRKRWRNELFNQIQTSYLLNQSATQWKMLHGERAFAIFHDEIYGSDRRWRGRFPKFRNQIKKSRHFRRNGARTPTSTLRTINFDADRPQGPSPKILHKSSGCIFPSARNGTDRKLLIGENTGNLLH